MARVVLLHGFTQTGRSWRGIADRLRAHGHEVMWPDAPGHGDAAEVRGDLWHAADRVTAVGGRAVYAGYSMGGRVALHAALAHPDLVTGLVLLGATAGIEDEDDRARRRAEDEARAVALECHGVGPFLDEWLAGPLFARLTRDAADVGDRLRNTASGLANSLRDAGTGSQEPLWSRLAELQMPVLCLAGEHDERFTVIARRMADTIGDNASAETIDGAGHAAHLEAPHAFAERLLRFAKHAR
jgi:2-succinyl-6-hydroxy-2,4-cyclohexadiene-1-carboxylate synthase